MLIFQFLAALSVGVRLSYFPLLALPVAYSWGRFPHRIQQFAAFFAGIAIWLVPLVIDTGWPDLVEAALAQTTGHFTDWGGAIITEPKTGSRLSGFVSALWAHGLGGYWNGRHWLTAITSLGLVIPLAALAFRVLPGSSNLVSNENKDEKPNFEFHIILIASLLIYAAWVFFFQNINYKPRHILPFLPFMLLAVAFGFEVIRKKTKPVFVAVMAVFFCGYIFTSIYLNIQHQKPTAIAQVKDYLIKNADSSSQIVSIGLVNYFLDRQGVDANFISIENGEEVIQSALQSDRKTFVIGKFEDSVSHSSAKRVTFYHNPYVNNMWDVVYLNQYCGTP